MYATLNPRQDLFNFIFPKTFFDNEIAVKYNTLLSQHPLVIDNIDLLVNESIQDITLPSFEYSPLEQQIQRGVNTRAISPNFQRANVNEQVLTPNTFTITLRHTEAYLTYFYLLEIFYSKFNANSQNKYVGDFVIQTKLGSNEIISNINFKKVLFTGLSELPLSFTNADRSFTSFTVSFYYTVFDTEFTIPKLKLT